MAIDKESLLMNSFEVLMKNYDDNLRNISNLIEKMMNFNIDLGTQLWKTVLTSHPETYKGKENWDSRYVTVNILSGIERQADDNYDTCIDILKSNDLIKSAVFKHSADLGFPLENILWRAIARSEYEFVFECLEMVNTNMSGEETVASFVNDFVSSYEDEYMLVNDSDEWKSKTMEFIVSLTLLITNEDEKAKAVVSLIDYM